MGDNTTTAQPSTSLSFFSDSFVIKHGKKPLRTMEFVLDLGNEANRSTLEKDIKHLGGKVIESFEEDGTKPFCIVTDHPNAELLEKVTKHGKFSSEFLCVLPMMLRIALKSGVRVRTYSSFCQILTNLKNRVKLDQNAKKAPARPKPEMKGVRKLTPPYIKLEDKGQLYAPSWKEYGMPNNFRPIYIGEAAGKSVFHRATPEYHRRREEAKMMKPRAKSHNGPGYCDICTRECHDLRMHFACKEHQSRISTPGFYDEVDALCGSYVKEIVVPNKRLRKRLSPEPLPLSTSNLHEFTSANFRFSSDSNDET